MRIIASANQKGGCGKTTTAINVAYCLSLKEQKVLLIDSDPQAHATMGLGINPADLGRTMYEVMKPQGYPPVTMDDILISVKDNLDLAPSSAKLSALEQELTGVDGRERKLFDALHNMKETYDFVIVDSPPSIGHLCFNALRASQEVVIPIDLSLFSLRGISKLIEIVMMLKENLNHDIETRALITMYDYRTRYAKHVMERVKDEFGDNVFKTVIRYNIRLRESVDCGIPVGEYDKRSIGNKDYEALTEELLQVGTINQAQTPLQTEEAEKLMDKSYGMLPTDKFPSEEEEREFSRKGDGPRGKERVYWVH
jgi:chromosome partitioning protein